MWSDVQQLPYLRMVLAESLRMYPQPPILIRRALGEDVLPPGLKGDPEGYPIGAGADIFISVWNLHRYVVVYVAVMCMLSVYMLSPMHAVNIHLPNIQVAILVEGPGCVSSRALYRGIQQP